MADMLRSSGYRTGIVGKWHLGENAQFHPQKRGFDEFFGFLGGGHRYFCDRYRARGGLRPVGSYDTLLEHNGQQVETKGYLTDVLADKAADFIHRHRSNPFFLYVAFNAPHSPVQAKDEDLAHFPNVQDNTRRTYCAMIKCVDDGVGRILSQLRRDGLENDTLIFFLSDNGGPLERNGSLNTPLSGEKGGMWEGGIRVPFIVQWKKRLVGGKLYERPVSSLDVLPTSLAAAGITASKGIQLDGIDLLPYFSGQATGDPHKALYWRMQARKIWAVRSGDWKLVRQPAWPSKHVGSQKPRLINLSEDLVEANDRSATDPDMTTRLQELYDAWNAGLPEPLWEIAR